MILLLLACKTPEIITIEGPNAALTVELVTPTDPACTYCDPFAAVDTLRVDVYGGDELLHTASFRYPSETPSLPYLDGFGVVRIELAGLSAGKVESGGRTDEIVLQPGVAQTVPMVFLPVNTVLPLGASLYSLRSRHHAFRRHDGSIVLMGGLDPGRDNAFDSIEVYSPTTRSFGVDQATLPAAGGAMAVTRTPSDDLLFAGGVTASGGVESTLTTAGVFQPDNSVLLTAGALSTGRAGGCVAALGATDAVAIGGTTSGTLDLGHYDASNGWAWSSVTPADFAAGQVAGCVGLDTGSVLVLGNDITSTGLWSYTPGGADDPTLSFTAANAYTAGDVRHVTGAVMIPLDDGTVWIAGGADPASDALTADGRRFSAASLSFSLAPGLTEARYDASWSPWYRPDWYVVGCGWQDVDRVRDEPSVELVNPVTAEEGVSVPLDRIRNGCSVTALSDGSVLVAGGFTTATAGETSAAILVPWPDEPPRDTGE